PSSLAPAPNFSTPPRDLSSFVKSPLFLQFFTQVADW
ncbi:MAG: hypothetical protein ACI8W3_000634, partial [Myxococcota bacterium]